MAASLTSDREKIEYLEARVKYLEDVIHRLSGEDEPLLSRLTKTESLIVHRLERGKGQPVSYESLMMAAHWRTDNPPQLLTLQRRVHGIKRKRPDIGRRLFTIPVLGYGLQPE